MGIAEIIKRTGLTKREGDTFLALARDVLSDHPELQESVLIGSMACKLLTHGRYTGRISEATDLDFFMEEIPQTLGAHLTEYPLVIRSGNTYGTVRYKIVFDVSPDLTFHTFKEGNSYHDKVDVFGRVVGSLRIAPKDVAYSKFDLRDDLVLRVATPGMLLATQIKPESFNQRRSQRARYLVQTVADTPALYEQAIVDCTSIFRKNGMTRGNFADVRKVVFEGLGNSVAYEQFVQFVQQVYNGLEKE
jgi:hypothetical protein